jgi:hypothetical protein
LRRTCCAAVAAAVVAAAVAAAVAATAVLAAAITTAVTSSASAVNVVVAVNAVAICWDFLVFCLLCLPVFNLFVLPNVLYYFVLPSFAPGFPCRRCYFPIR